MSKEDKTIKELKRVNHNLKHKYELLEIRYHALDDKCELLKEDISNYVKITLHDRKEIERLNNIINEFEKYLDEELKDGNLQNSYYGGMCWKSVKAQYMERIIKKFQELKGVDKE